MELEEYRDEVEALAENLISISLSKLGSGLVDRYAFEQILYEQVLPSYLRDHDFIEDFSLGVDVLKYTNNIDFASGEVDVSELEEIESESSLEWPSRVMFLITYWAFFGDITDQVNEIVEEAIAEHNSSSIDKKSSLGNDDYV